MGQLRTAQVFPVFVNIVFKVTFYKKKKKKVIVGRRHCSNGNLSASDADWGVSESLSMLLCI